MSLVIIVLILNLIGLLASIWFMIRNQIVRDYLISRINNDDRHYGDYDSVFLHPIKFSVIKMLKYIRKNGVKD